MRAIGLTRRTLERPLTHPPIPLLPILPILLIAGCDALTPRTPEAPIQEGGTYVQPDTPEDVIANLENALRELSPLNYRRSLADDFAFVPTASAQERYAVWNGWGPSEEEAYFRALAAAATPATLPLVTLDDRTLAILAPDRYRLDARYRLSLPHASPQAPTEVTGRLVWEIEQGMDGLWRLTRWTDQEDGTGASWSDLKAAFVR